MKKYLEHFTLSNGIKIQKVSYGTWQVKENEVLKKLIPTCFDLGLMHIDTAYDYRNEMMIGPILKNSGVKRENYFITSKLASHLKGYDITKKYFKESLDDLQLDYLDLYLIHAPWPWSDIGKDCTDGNIESWKAMIDLYKEGKIRSIGVSNFAIKDIEALISTTGFVPHVNQICFFIGHYDKELIDYCQKKGILIEAYSPLGTGKVLNNETITKMANKYNVTVPQLCIRYCLQHNTLPIFKTNHEEYLRSNLLLDFVISDEDMKFLDILKIA